MNVTYTEDVKQSSEGYSLLQQATTCLEEVIGLSADLVKAEWDCIKDVRQRTLYTLRLSDWSGEVSASYTQDQLQSLPKLRYGLIRLWGDLLQVRSHKQLQRLTSGADRGEE